MTHSLKVYDSEEWESVSSINNEGSRLTPNEQDTSPSETAYTTEHVDHRGRTNLTMSNDLCHMEFKSESDSEFPDISESVISATESESVVSATDMTESVTLDKVLDVESGNESNYTHIKKRYTEEFDSLESTSYTCYIPVQESSSVTYSSDFEHETEAGLSDAFKPVNENKGKTETVDLSSSFPESDTFRSSLNRSLSNSDGHSLRLSGTEKLLNNMSLSERRSSLNRSQSIDASMWSRHAYNTYSDSSGTTTGEETSSVDSVDSVIPSARYDFS